MPPRLLFLFSIVLPAASPIYFQVRANRNEVILLASKKVAEAVLLVLTALLAAALKLLTEATASD